MEQGDLVELDQEVFQGVDPRVHGGAEEVIQEVNYFTPRTEDVWTYIFDNLTDANDVVSVMNASPLLRDLMKERRASASASALLSLAVPIIMQQDEERLAPEDILNCRLINKQVKASVDNAIVLQRPSWIPQRTYTLNVLAQTQAFLNRAEGFVGNPFLARYCVTRLEDETPELPQVLEIFRRYGHELHIVRLEDLTNWCPRRRMEILRQVLRYLPNVQVLVVGFAEFEVEDESVWDNYRTFSSSLPSLPSLTTLILSYWDDNVNMTVPLTASFLRPVLFAYRRQISYFTIDVSLLRGDLWRPLHFRNLCYLTVSFTIGMDSGGLREIYRNLAKLRCRQLKSLALSGIGMRLTLETFSALNKFRKSLKQLRMGSLEGDFELFQVNPLRIREFPHLKRLSLCTRDVGTELMHLFRVQFANLKEIRFEAPNTEERVGVEPPVPTKKVSRRYFTLFPKLQQLIWIQTEGGEEHVYVRV